jgi:serine O-acetyltransferase
MSNSIEKFYERLDASMHNVRVQVPPKAEAHRLADGLFLLLFPALAENPKPASVQGSLLKKNLQDMLSPLLQMPLHEVEAVTDQFFQTLPEAYNLLLEDAQAILNFDPAATCIEEVMATYPGFYAIAIYRIAHILNNLRIPLLPRVFSEHAHGKTGIDIHPGAKIGRHFFIDHGTGVVIGATAVIGDYVKIYQGVTLGALQVDKSMANVKRHPTIEDNCVIYANSTILGGRTVIGHDSVIGGNSWVTESVDPFSVVLHQGQSKIRQRPFDEPVSFVI